MSDPSERDQAVLGPLSEANHEAVEPTYRFVLLFIHTLIKWLIRRDWRDQAKLPQTGGLVVVVNHISNADPIAVVQYLAFSGRWARFLAKDSLFRVPLVAQILAAAGQIPVQRNSRSASDALSAAIVAVQQGKCVVVYPEGTITTDPDLWPMAGKTGAARIAYATGCPIIPVAQWGAQDIMYGKRIEFPKLLPRKTFRVTTGDPVPLEPGESGEVTSAMLVRTTQRMMATLTDLVGELRQETPPTGAVAADAPAPGDSAPSNPTPSEPRPSDAEGDR